MSRDGRKLATFGADKLIKLWDLQSISIDLEVEIA